VKGGVPEAASTSSTNVPTSARTAMSAPTGAHREARGGGGPAGDGGATGGGGGTGGGGTVATGSVGALGSTAGASYAAAARDPSGAPTRTDPGAAAATSGLPILNRSASWGFTRPE
jgi:hypothetical protein